MDRELLKAKFQDDTFEAVVDYEEGEILIRYHNDLPNELRMDLNDLVEFSEFIDNLWEMEKQR